MRQIRGGLTLLEILISMGVFLAVGVAMLAIFTVSVNMYRRGEQARSADDQAMTALNYLSRDLAAAVPARQGGHFEAELLDDCGNMSLGWSVRREQPGDEPWEHWDFVVYETSGSATDAALLRRTYRGTEAAFLDDPLDPAASTSSTAEIISGVLHWSASLAGTPFGAGASVEYLECPVPGHGDWNLLSTIVARPQTPQPGEPLPNPDTDRYTTIGSDRPYPTAIRLRLVLAGVNQNSRATRVISDDGAEALRLGGESVAGQGAIIRIGDELIGLRGGMAGGLVLLNRGPRTENGEQMPADGPVATTSNGANTPGSVPSVAAGRGLWFSDKPASGHPRGAVVTPGRLHTLVHLFP